MRTEIAVPFDLSNMGRASRKLSLLALTAALSAGCSNMIPLREPVFTGSTANQQQIIAGQTIPANGANPASPAYGATAYGASGYTQNAGVQSADLPPPPGAQATAYANAPAYGAPGAAPQPYTPPKPYAANGLPTPVGQVGNRPAPTNGQTPTLASLGSPPTTLGDQAVRVDGGTNRSNAGPGGSYTVQSGDTMWNIAQRHGVSVDALVSANGGSTVAKLGQRLSIPGGQQPRNVQVASIDPRAGIPMAPPVGQAATVVAPPVVPNATVQGETQVALAPQTGAAAAQAPAAPQATANSSAFRWPVRGRVISGFGKKPNGERNDGINLAVPEGSSVKASEDGTVIYAGNELKSYGNLVLVRHSNGWVSAYAHNSELKVKRGEQVRRGQVIALSGMSGGVTTPQVHFELRKDATPVDPLQHLSES
jgi:murein DD-endopeptidase MepM/ murein hydrolase activator NlpD